jgi:hypothetical protein
LKWFACVLKRVIYHGASILRRHKSFISFRTGAKVAVDNLMQARIEIIHC